MTPEIDVNALAARLAAGDDVSLLDVREQWEYETARLPNTTLIPLSELPSAIATLDRDRAYIVLCHHGTRSGMAVGWLRQQGFANVVNLAGGIDAWSALVDPSVPRY